MNRLLPHLLRRSTRVLPLLLALALVPWAALARAPAALVDLQVVDRDSGTVLPQYRHGGQAWLAGEPGRDYAVRLRNLGPERVLVVLSVDGVNAVSGQTADPRQAGYVLGPWQSLEVEGWRKSMEAVARFVFVDPAASYAARTGRPDNVGVIGVAVFREAQVPSTAAIVHGAAPGSAAKQERQAAMPQAYPPARSGDIAAQQQEADVAQGLGTGHGAPGWSPAYATPFKRQPRVAQLTQLRYDTWQGLRARGIAAAPPVHPRPGWSRTPQAFPGGFVPDPPCCERW